MDAAWKNRTNSAAAFEPGELAAWDFSPLLSLPSLDNTFGAFLIGTFLSLILYGICVHQAYRYFRLYQRDGAVIKTVVAAMIIGETLYAAVCMHACYYYLVTNYFDPLSLLRGVWSIQLLSLLTGALIFISQSFFSWRVYILRPRLSPLVTIAVFFSIVSFGFSIAATTEGIRVHLFSRFKHYTWLDSIALGAAVISDLITTSVLTIVLTQSRTGVRQTDRIVERLILYAVNTGLLTGIFNLLALIFALVWPDNLIYFGVCVVGAKMYSNSLLAVLNTHHSLVGRGTEHSANSGERGLSLPGTFSSADSTNPPVASTPGVKSPASALVRGPLTVRPDLWAAQHQMVGSDTAIELGLNRTPQVSKASNRV